MATGKKYFWIKLKTDFMTSDKVDYLMSQTNGAEYVVLYQMLCMKCINTDGLLARQIGEVIIPFDAEKIARDCKYFSIDTVKQAFQLFIQLGMIYQEGNGYLRIADFDNMVGSETDWAEQKRKQIKTKKIDLIECGSSVETSVENLHTDIRDRDKILDIDINSKSSGKPEKKESPLTLVKNAWNNNFIKLYSSKPDSQCESDEKKLSFWKGVTKIIGQKLTSYDYETLITAIDYAQYEDWIVESGYVISTILSDNVINKALSNSPHSNNSKYNQNKYESEKIKKNLANKIQL